ncbi:hypothetical protein AMAG_07247 [Allomyces macrogynus ATCC 38327]|uniref:Uncharacterized protein n=1 Tax=Allomyces macrogynus (strain ATCC 38327) TaxID=578462 RepID=A0A0L0SI20_ALLM3|nr:hypothetical protein, variant [Allomyces macrogynus ATCC 38327]KNE61985.1 hypothetical protein AMAG_07247 [Allomyces macrogynus ATCC 38327]|eukprot:KNE61984.1 hypothetical protein, variant [Allomyces macrogynus ATCC 38327]
MADADLDYADGGAGGMPDDGAGSPDLTADLVNERDALRAQNEQLWRLVEKQRAVVSSLKLQLAAMQSVLEAHGLLEELLQPAGVDGDAGAVPSTPTMSDVSAATPDATAVAAPELLPPPTRGASASGTDNVVRNNLAVEVRKRPPRPPLHVRMSMMTVPPPAAVSVDAPPVSPTPRNAMPRSSLVAAVDGDSAEDGEFGDLSSRGSYLAYYDDDDGDAEHHDEGGHAHDAHEHPEDHQVSSMDAPDVAPAAEPHPQDDQPQEPQQQQQQQPSMQMQMQPPHKAFDLPRGMPHDVPFRIGRLRPSSQLAPYERRPTVRVQFAAETIIHEPVYEEYEYDSGAEPVDPHSEDGFHQLQIREAEADADLEQHVLDEDDGPTYPDYTDANRGYHHNPPQFPPPRQLVLGPNGQPQFPPRSRSSMMANAGPRGMQHPALAAAAAADAPARPATPDMPFVAPARGNSRVHARDSIFLSRNYRPPSQFVNETRRSMLMGQAPPQAPANGPAPPPRRTSTHPGTYDQDPVLKALLANKGDRAALQQQLQGLAPHQIAQLQAALRDRMGAPQQAPPESQA